MEKIDTGIPIVHRYDHVIDQFTSELYCKVLTGLRGLDKKHDSLKLPWFENDTITWWQLPDLIFRRKVFETRKLITSLVQDSFQTEVYPTYSALSIWRQGKQMIKHKDNGYANETNLYHRTHTAILYLNDNFLGGETFIDTQWGQYISRPKTGSLICFPSDESAEHGVKTVETGIRFTFALWFCTDKTKAEDIVYASQIVL